MTARTHADARSSCFRELMAEKIRLERWTLADFRTVWRLADARAREWRRRATNRYNHSTRTWEQGA